MFNVIFEFRLENMWGRLPGIENQYWTILSSMEDSSQTLIFGCALLSYLQSKKNEELLQTVKKSMLDSFIKITISTKVKPDSYLVENCKPLLKILSHEDFKGVLLPALLRAILRNPEIIMASVGHILSSVSLDLSSYAAELGKPIATCLHSSEDAIRDHSAFATESLAKQCSGASAVRGLLTLYFGVLQGSDGKLTVTSHKISMLQGIGYLSKHCVISPNDHKLSCDTADHFVKILESEVHEGTLNQALASLSLWAARLGGQAPKPLMEIFKKGMTLKTSTPIVRTNYIRCMTAAFHGESLAQSADLIPTLLKSLEKAVAQPTQAPAVAEGLAAASLLLKCATIDSKVSDSSFYILLKATLTITFVLD